MPPLSVEVVVGGLHQLAVRDDGPAEVHVQRVQEVVPRVVALQLAPPGGVADDDGARRRTAQR